MSLTRIFRIMALATAAAATSGCVATIAAPGIIIHTDPHHRRPVYGPVYGPPVYGPVYRPAPHYPAPRYDRSRRHHRYPGHHHR